MYILSSNQTQSLARLGMDDPEETAEKELGTLFVPFLNLFSQKRDIIEDMVSYYESQPGTTKERVQRMLRAAPNWRKTPPAVQVGTYNVINDRTDYLCRHFS